MILFKTLSEDYLVQVDICIFYAPKGAYFNF